MCVKIKFLNILFFFCILYFILLLESQKTCDPPRDYVLYGNEATNHGTTTGTGFLGSNTAMVFDGSNDYRNFGTTVEKPYNIVLFLFVFYFIENYRILVVNLAFLSGFD